GRPWQGGRKEPIMKIAVARAPNSDKPQRARIRWPRAEAAQFSWFRQSHVVLTPGMSSKKGGVERPGLLTRRNPGEFGQRRNSQKAPSISQSHRASRFH